MYNKNWERAKKLILLAAVVIAVIVVVVVLNNNSKVNTQNNQTNNAGNNYTESTDGTKVNTSEQVSQDKKVEDVTLEKSSIIYSGGMSTLTSKVTNNGTDKENLRFKVKFLANDGSVIVESVGYVGQIKSNETKTITSYITMDTSNAKDITYEVIQ